jgi:hypothetical protein
MKNDVLSPGDTIAIAILILVAAILVAALTYSIIAAAITFALLLVIEDYYEKTKRLERQLADLSERIRAGADGRQE